MSRNDGWKTALVSAMLACAGFHGYAQVGTVAGSLDRNASTSPMPRSWAVRVPGVDKVVFRGGVNHDAAGMGAGTMMYPAPSPVGFLAALITHGVLNAGFREKQKNQMQANADLILAPFEPVLAGFTNQRLLEAGRQRLPAERATRLLNPNEPAGGDWLVEIAPVFSMTQDRRALVLDNAVRIFGPGSSPVVYAQTVRVVSAPLPAAQAVAAATEPAPVADDEFVKAWSANQGQKLIDESTSLLAQSLEIALAESGGPATDDKTPHRTFRYPEGGSEKMERAQLVSEGCGRRLIRTLRGWLMSVPSDDTIGDRCALSPAGAASAAQ